MNLILQSIPQSGYSAVESFLPTRYYWASRSSGMGERRPKGIISATPSMKKAFLLILLLIITLAGCTGDQEPSLELAVGAEPSAKMHNDEGRAHYKAGRHYDALLKFTQAKTADHTSGEIHFNLALALHQRGEPDRAREHFLMAKKFADGNVKILESALLNRYLNETSHK
jgi:Flp pilus assembly protein TadD